MLVIIDRQWLSITDDETKRQFDNPEDFVRFEAERGVNCKGLLLIPILVDGASKPKDDDLPETLPGSNLPDSLFGMH